METLVSAVCKINLTELGGSFEGMRMGNVCLKCGFDHSQAACPRVLGERSTVRRDVPISKLHGLMNGSYYLFTIPPMAQEFRPIEESFLNLECYIQLCEPADIAHYRGFSKQLTFAFRDIQWRNATAWISVDIAMQRLMENLRSCRAKCLRRGWHQNFRGFENWDFPKSVSTPIIIG